MLKWTVSFAGQPGDIPDFSFDLSGLQYDNQTGLTHVEKKQQEIKVLSFNPEYQQEVIAMNILGATGGMAELTID